MAQFTKQAIISTFTSLLNKKPLDRITVTDIVDKCGINRNTFYYYFTDIFALADELLKLETAKITEGRSDFSTWQEAFFEATRFALDNKAVIYHLYNSVNRDRLEKYIYDVTFNNMSKFVMRQAQGLDAEQQDIDAISVFYAAALEGLVRRWLNDGMKEDPRPLISRLGILLDGNISAALMKDKSAVASDT